MKHINTTLLFVVLLTFTLVFSKPNLFANEVISEETTSILVETSSNEISAEETSNTDNNEETSTNISEINETKKILFIGNSATYYNKMPKMVKGLAIAAGKDIEITTITHSGYKLSEFAAEDGPYLSTITSTLAENTFDYVIMQDHREVMIENPTSTEEAFLILKDLIDKNGAEIILYETQADSEGRTFKINGSSVFLDHSMMQYYLTKNYFYLGNKYNVEVSAAGPNYTRCTEMFPEINLYNKDKLHPSVEGSYLAACTIYESIFNESAFNNGFLPNSEYDVDNLLEEMSVDDAIKIQKLCDVRVDLINYNMTMQKTTNSTLETIYTVSEGNDCLYNNTAEITYSNNIEYYSLNDDVIAINRKTGAYTAIKVGEAMVMAISDDGVMSMCNITVKQSSTSLKIKKTSIVTLLKGETYTYELIVSPKDSTDSISWSTDYPAVATVDENGTVTAHKAGVANITATTENGLSVTRTVRVKLATPTKLNVKKLKTKAKSNKYANIKISWKNNINAYYFSVFRKSSTTSKYKKIGTTTANYYIDNNRKKGKIYYYKIKAIHTDTNLNSSYSSIVSITLSN